MMLAGLRLPNDDVRELARLVDEPTATLLRNALERETVVLALTVPDREQILRALDDPPTEGRRAPRRAARRARVAGARGPCVETAWTALVCACEKRGFPGKKEEPPARDDDRDPVPER